MAKKANFERRLKPAEVRAVADQLSTFIDDDEIGAVMALVYALTYCDAGEREDLSFQIEAALLGNCKACFKTLDNLAGAQMLAAKRRAKAEQ